MNFEDDVYGELESFGISLVDTLADGVAESGQMTDPMSGDPIPNDHYAHTCFAVAAFRAFERTGRTDYLEAGINTLDYYLSLNTSRRGHGEFNAFALLEAMGDARRGRYDLPRPESRFLKAISFDSRINSREGNNWLLLRGLCHLQLSKRFGRRRDRIAFSRIRRLITGWQQEDGILADAPRYPIAPIETPLTYHAKLGTLCTRIASITSTHDFSELALRAFHAIDSIRLPDGEALFFGRSENSLFGYATAIDGSFRLEESNQWLPKLRHRLTSYFLTAFDSDRANSLPGGDSACAIDDYVIDGVYASYAAMILLGLPRAEIDATGDYPDREPVRQLETAGLTTVSGNLSALGIADNGQLKFVQNRPDPRYAGLIPLTFTYDDETVCPGIPREFLTSESFPYLPVIGSDDSRFVPVTWSSLRKNDSNVESVIGVADFYGLPIKAGDPTPHRIPDKADRRPVLGFVDRALRSAARTCKVDLAVERWRKRSRNVPFSTFRAVHYLQKADILVVQTVTDCEAGVTVNPTNWVVTEPHTDDIRLDYGGEIELRSKSVQTHKGPATWLLPEENVTTSDNCWSSVVIDPARELRSVRHEVTSEALYTNCELSDDEISLELNRQPQYAPDDEDEGKRLSSLDR